MIFDDVLEKPATSLSLRLLPFVAFGLVLLFVWTLADAAIRAPRPD